MAIRPTWMPIPSLVSGQRRLAHHDQHESERVLPVGQARLVGGYGRHEGSVQAGGGEA